MNRQLIALSALGVLLVAALWWVLLYNPGREELAGIEDEITAVEGEGQSLEQRIAVLEAVRAEAPETEALLGRYAGIVPSDPAVPAALRQVSAAADDAGVVIDQITTTRPTPLAEGEGRLHTMDLSMTVAGSYFQIVDFLRRLEDPTITARGVLVTTVGVTATEYPTLSASISGTMFAVLDPPPEGGVAPEEEPAADAADGEGDAGEGEEGGTGEGEADTGEGEADGSAAAEEGAGA